METQVTFRLGRDDGARVQALADRLGLKRSQVLRLAVHEFLARMEEEGQSPYDRVRDLAGSVRTGVRDLGERHREHMKRLLRADGPS